MVDYNHPKVKDPERSRPDPRRAEIANLFIYAGFSYLRMMNRDNITRSHERTIDEAIDLGNYLSKALGGRPIWRAIVPKKEEGSGTEG